MLLDVVSEEAPTAFVKYDDMLDWLALNTTRIDGRRGKDGHVYYQIRPRPGLDLPLFFEMRFCGWSKLRASR
jgi:hypothetical protein